MHEAPSIRPTMLLPMPSAAVNSFLPATLEMVRKPKNYAIAAQYMTKQVPAELSKAASNTLAGVAFYQAI